MSTTEKVEAMAEELVSGRANIMEEAALDHARLDFSYDSLSVIDRYLETLHAKNLSGMKLFGFIPAGRRGDLSKAFQTDPAFETTVTSVGAYVGEAIRRSSPVTSRWASFSELEKADPEAAETMRNASPLVKEFNLIRDGDGVTWPTNKVAKYIMNGPEESTYFYAKVINREEAEDITAQIVAGLNAQD
jgi:hypothetical protein